MDTECNKHVKRHQDESLSLFRWPKIKSMYISSYIIVYSLLLWVSWVLLGRGTGDRCLTDEGIGCRDSIESHQVTLVHLAVAKKHRSLWVRNLIPHRNSVQQELLWQKETNVTWMYSISSNANGLLWYLAGNRWIEARVSGVPETGGARGLNGGGEAAALCGERLTASVFRASCTEKQRRKKTDF